MLADRFACGMWCWRPFRGHELINATTPARTKTSGFGGESARSISTAPTASSNARSRLNWDNSDSRTATRRRVSRAALS